MKKLRIGVLGPADIADRRMIPAILKSEYYSYAGVAVSTSEERTAVLDGTVEEDVYALRQRGLDKADVICKKYGGHIYNSYEDMIGSDSIDVVYVAHPPAFHAYWGRQVLTAGKHLLMEKPFTNNYLDTKDLVTLAREHNLATIENFGFLYHPQMKEIERILVSGEIGEIRCIRTNFGFPHRGKNDFRYKKILGGGALLDCGCYTIRLAQKLLGNTIHIEQAHLYSDPEYDIDMGGSITISDDHSYAQLSFSMDQQYCCDLEILGSKGSIRTDRIYTAPADYKACLIIKKGMEEEKLFIETADQFLLVAERLRNAIECDGIRESIYNEIESQGECMEICSKQRDQL